MRYPALIMLSATLTGCTASEPLAPGFAGEWASAAVGCSGPRITVSKSGIASAGMPIDGLTFSEAKVSGATAHVVIELSPAARMVVQNNKSAGSKSKEQDVMNLEILATLIASGPRIMPTNVIFRDKTTRQLQAADRDVLAVMTLVQCKARDTRRA